MPSVLVTGGAGYIGCHAVWALIEAGYEVVVVDDLSAGVRQSVADSVKFYEGRLQDQTLLSDILSGHKVNSVMHFAGSVQVAESVSDPLKYYENNTAASRSLIEICIANGVQNFIFSSTAAVYGTPATVPVNEDAPVAPINPYGWSKLMTEQTIKDAADAHGFSYGILRYFNVAGADPEGRVGQCMPEATHLIKVACETALGKRSAIEIFGTDYDTPDGTGIRDYIHVTDLVAAHIKLLAHLESGGKSKLLNCGYGHGYSVQEVLDKLEEVSGLTVTRRLSSRRSGDAAEIVADNSRIVEELDWAPQHDELEVILRTAFEWERKLGQMQER